MAVLHVRSLVTSRARIAADRGSVASYGGGEVRAYGSVVRASTPGERLRRQALAGVRLSSPVGGRPRPDHHQPRSRDGAGRLEGRACPGSRSTPATSRPGLESAATVRREGRFTLPGLPVGPYEVKAEPRRLPPARAPERHPRARRARACSRLDPRAGRPRRRSWSPAISPGCKTRSGELGYLVSEEAIRDLPLNGRNYTDLAFLQPGVIAFPFRDGGSVVAHGLGASVNGQDPRANVYLLDGTLMNDFTNGPAGSAAGTALGTESVREFRVEVERLRRGVRPERRRPDQRPHQVGNERLPRRAYEYLQERRARRAQLLRPRGEAGLPPPPVRLHPGRPRAQGPDVLLRRATRACARTWAGRCPPWCRTWPRAAGILPDPPARGHDHGAREPGGPALPRRVPAAERRGARPGASPPTRFPFAPDPRPGLLPGAPRPERGRPRPALRPLHLRQGRASTCPPTSRSSRGPSSRRTSSRPRSTATSCPRGPSPPCASATAARGSGRRWRPTPRSRSRPSCPAATLPGDIDIGGIPRFGTQSSANLSLRQDVFAFHGDVVHTRGRHLLKGGRPGRALQAATCSTRPSASGSTPSRAWRPSCGTGRSGSSASPPRATSSATGAPPSSPPTCRTTSALGRVTLNAGLRYEYATLPRDTKGRDINLPDLLDPQVTVGPLYAEPDRQGGVASAGLRLGRAGQRPDVACAAATASTSRPTPSRTSSSPSRTRPRPRGP